MSKRMAELFIIELFIGAEQVWTTAVAEALEVNATIRPLVYTRAQVTHWIRDGMNANAPGWRKHREVASWY